MLKSQKLSVELSQVRSKLLDDSLESADRDKLVSDYQDLESRHAAAVITEGGDDGEEKPAPRDLVSRIDVGEYATAAVENHGALTGPAKELADELETDSDRAVIPWAVLADGLEDRADATSSGPTTGEQSTQAAALRRIFKGSLVDALGVAVRNVGSGKHAFPVLASGVAPAWYAKSAEVSSTAASITAKEIAPIRLSGRYSWTREDAFEFSQLADLLRNDLRQAIVAKSGDTVVNGAGTSQPSGIFKTLGNAPTAPDAVATLADYRNAVLDSLGDYADNTSEVRLLVARDAFKYLSGLGHSADGDPLGVEHIRSLADLRPSGVLKNAPASGSRANISEAVAYGTRGAGTGILAFWGGGVELVADATSGVGKAEIYLTGLTFANLVWRVTSPYRRVSFKLG